MEYRIIEMGYENIGFYPENKREDCIVWRSLKEENMVGFGYKTIEEAEERINKHKVKQKSIPSYNFTDIIHKR